MGNLAHLQERLSAAFGGAAAKPQEQRAAEKAASAAPNAQTAHDSKTADLPPLRPDPYRYWLGGAGLLVSALVLVLGYLDGFLLLAVAMVAHAAGWAFAYLLWRRKGGAAAPAATGAVSESQQDQHWERSESAVLAGRIYDALGDIAVTRTIDRRIVRANAIFRHLTGCDTPEGLTCEELGLVFRPGAQPQRYEVECSAPDGRRFFIWHDVVIRDPATGRLLLQSIARDVTEERSAAEAQEEARRKAEYNSAAKSRLLATVSHEIRTPLSGILGMAHLLGQTRTTREQANYLTGIRQSGNALVQLVEDLLDFSTIEAGRFHLHSRPEALRPLLEGVIEMLAHRAHEKGIEIGATISPHVPERMGFDPARLRQVLFNVVGNAVKFTHSGGVFVRAAIEGSELTIAVEDSGPGMTAEEQGRIFGEFEQAGTSSEKSGGTGLGLAISARIIREFGGKLMVLSEKGKGSTFTIRFPVTILADDAGDEERQTLLAGRDVLLLAPQGPAARAIGETVRMLGGTCRLATSGKSACAMLDGGARKPFSPTHLIVDHRMAAQFFNDLAERADVNAPHLRKVFLVNPEERSSHSLDLFDAWLIRPLREQSLIDVLRGRLGGPQKRGALNDNQSGSAVAPVMLPASALNIVLGEDDPVNAMLVRAVLEKSGHNVRLVGDFTALLHCATATGEERPDIVISDLSMPGGSGLDMLARLRAHERRFDLPPLPVVVLTADSRDTTRRDALLNGANAVAAKPVDPERLLADVRSLVALSQQASKKH